MNLKTFKFLKLFASFKEYETEQGKLVIDELVEGAEAMILGEDGELVAAADGEYITEDGKITVADGKIVSIEEIVEEPENTEVEESMAKQKFNAVKEKFEATYQEIQNNIYSALSEQNIWGYLIENTNEYAIVSVWGEDEKEHLYKYQITIAEDGKVTLGEYAEVKTEYVETEETIEPKTEEIETEMSEEEKPTEEQTEDEVIETNPELEEANRIIEEKDAKIAELDSRIAELEEALNKPIEEPLNMSAVAKPVECKNSGAMKYFG